MATVDERYPEHAKLREVSKQSQALGEFLDVYLPSQNIVLAEYDLAGHLWATHRTIRDLLADFFSIDQKKIDDEKKQMLAELRGEIL